MKEIDFPIAIDRKSIMKMPVIRKVWGQFSGVGIGIGVSSGDDCHNGGNVWDGEIDVKITINHVLIVAQVLCAKLLIFIIWFNSFHNPMK